MRCAIPPSCFFYLEFLGDAKGSTLVVHVFLLGTVLAGLGLVLGGLGGVLVRLGSILGGLWGVLEASWGVLGASWRGGEAVLEDGSREVLTSWTVLKGSSKLFRVWDHFFNDF